MHMSGDPPPLSGRSDGSEWRRIKVEVEEECRDSLELSLIAVQRSSEVQLDKDTPRLTGEGCPELRI
jgi:hypothetical protein